MTEEQIEKGISLLKKIKNLEEKLEKLEKMLEYAQYRVSTMSIEFSFSLPSEDLKWVVEKEIVKVSKEIDMFKDEFIKL
jgi:hypothetical protein